jgi:hypothetical protein
MLGAGTMAGWPPALSVDPHRKDPRVYPKVLDELEWRGLVAGNRTKTALSPPLAALDDFAYFGCDDEPICGCVVHPDRDTLRRSVGVARGGSSSR